MTDEPSAPDNQHTTVGVGAPPDPPDDERQQHIDLINEQLQTGTCVEWEPLSLNRQRIVIEHNSNPTFTTILAGLRDGGWVPEELDSGDETTTLIVEKVHGLGQRITFDDCPKCEEAAIEFGDRVENRGLASGKRIYCTECGVEWTVSFKHNNCDRGCCPFNREITLDPIYSEEQKIGPASDEYDSVTLVRGVDPDAKIEFYQQTRPAEKVTVYDSIDDAPDHVSTTVQIAGEHDATLDDDEREELWETRLSELNEK